MPAKSSSFLLAASRKRLGLGLIVGMLLSATGATGATSLVDPKPIWELRAAAGPKLAQDPKFTAPGGFRLLMVGEKDPEQKSFTNAVFDGAGMGRVFASGIQVNSGSSLTLVGCRLVNAPRLHIVFIGTTLSLDQCYVGKIGMLSLPGDHLEAIFVHAGHVSYTHTLFDVTGSPTPPSSLSGVLFFKATDGQIDAVIDHCIITGILSLKGNYAIQAGSAGHDINLTISNTGLQKGTSGYVGLTTGVGKVSLIDGGGNYDIDTGKPITLR
jgi:hypothetical protein